MRGFFTSFILIMALWSSAQINLYLSDYSVTAENNLAFISWTTSSGFTCEDITIEHSTDTVSFKPVYIYPGICGADNKEEKYSYLFRDVVYNTTNYFRINLGKFGTSPIFSIHLVSLDGLAPKVYPNPTNASGVILFANDDKNEAQIQVYNATGVAIGTSPKTQDNHFLISELNIKKSGLYYYTIQLNGVITRGKFLFL